MPTMIRITTQQPDRERNDVGRVDIGWFVQTDDTVTLCDEDANPLPGDWSHELKPGQDPRVIARCLLREQLASRGKGFDQPITYSPSSEIA